MRVTWPALAADGDRVADADRAVEQDDEARNVVGGDLLQAEAEADAERAAEHRQRGQIDADRGQADQHGHHDQQRLGQRATAPRADSASSPGAAISRASIAPPIQSATSSVASTVAMPCSMSQSVEVLLADIEADAVEQRRSGPAAGR